MCAHGAGHRMPESLFDTVRGATQAHGPFLDINRRASYHSKLCCTMPSGQAKMKADYIQVAV